MEENESLIDMNRWNQVRDIYSVLIKIERRPRTKINIFNAIVVLIQCCDKKNIEQIFSFESIQSFVSELKTRYLDGIKGKTLMQIQSSIKAVLLEVDPILLNDLKNEFLYLPADTSPIQPFNHSTIH